MEICIEEISVGERKRKVSEEKVLMLVDNSIKEIGLLNPITLTEDYHLVTGAHRVPTEPRIGWKTIAAEVRTFAGLDAELAEIDENLIRNELTVLERGEMLKRRKEIYEVKYPQTRMGGAPGKAGGGKVAKTEMISSFAADTGKKTGQTARTIRQEVQIANDISEPVKKAIREMPMANNKTELISLARMKPERQKEIVEKITSGKAGNVKSAKIALQADSIRLEPPPLPKGPFRVIVLDPPWSYDNRASDSTHRAANPYPSMTLEDIRALPIASLSTKDAIVWLWTTNAHLPVAFGLLESWGFQYKTVLTWVKDRMGLGDWLRGQTEHCLMGVKGKPTVQLTNQTTVIHGALREHSRKPDSFYALVESLCPGSRVELFQREQRKGWAGYGDDVERFSGQ